MLTTLRPTPLWTGRPILSLCIPKGINIFRAPEPKVRGDPPPNDPYMDNGMMVDKKTVGATQGGLVRVVFCMKGPEATTKLFSGLQMVVNHWPFHDGFSIGIGDTIADKGPMDWITNNITE